MNFLTKVISIGLLVSFLAKKYNWNKSQAEWVLVAINLIFLALMLILTYYAAQFVFFCRCSIDGQIFDPNNLSNISDILVINTSNINFPTQTPGMTT